MSLELMLVAPLLVVALMPFGAFAVAFAYGAIACRAVNGFVDIPDVFDRAVMFALAFGAFEFVAALAFVLIAG